MDNTPIFIPADIAMSTAPLLLGCILNWCLFGGLCVQSYYYYIAFPKDRLVLKILVYGLLVVETAQSILMAHDVFMIFARGFGNPAAVRDPQLTWLDGPVIAAIVSCTVQIYFAHKIHAISGSRIAGIIIILLSLLQGICAIISGVKALQLNDVTVLQSRAHTSITIWLVGSAVCDIIIATFLVFFLSRKTTSFKATQALITKVIRLTIETGSMTAAMAIIDVVLFLAFPENNYHVAPALILGKLYSNTLLTTLNSRLNIVNGRNGARDSYRMDSAGRSSAERIHRVRVPGTVPYFKKEETSIAVNIEREVWTNNIPLDHMDGQESTRSKVKAKDAFV